MIVNGYRNCKRGVAETMAVLDEFNKINDSFDEVYENADKMEQLMDRQAYKTKLMHWVLGNRYQTRNYGCFANSR
jgi:maltooligosyltrehalose synthase